jgi:16S rRNA processing protein RimM
MESGYVEIGKILKPYGLQGRVKILSYADSLERFFKGKELFLVQENGMRPVVVSEIKGGGKNPILKFQDRDDRRAAEALTGASLYIKSEELKKLPKGEFYRVEIIGSRVCDESGRCLGVLENIFTTSAHDVWVVKDGSKEMLVPAVEEFVASVDPVQKEVRLRATQGLDQINDL